MNIVFVCMMIFSHSVVEQEGLRFETWLERRLESFYVEFACSPHACVVSLGTPSGYSPFGEWVNWRL